MVSRYAEVGDGTHLGAHSFMDKLDASSGKLIFSQGTSLPGSGAMEGHVFWRTDTDQLYTWDGAAWILTPDQSFAARATGLLQTSLPVPSVAYSAPNIVATVTGAHQVYIQGQKYLRSTASVSIAASEGIHFVYYNSSGTLTIGKTVWNLETNAPLFLFYWDASNNVALNIAYEFHGISMDPVTHAYLHTTRGTAYESGFDITFTLGSTTDTTIGLTGGKIHDEDITVTIAHAASPSGNFQQILTKPAQLPVFYLSGSGAVTRKATTTTKPYLTAGSGRIAYNQFTGGAWQQTEVANGDFVAYYVLATNHISEPIIVIQGQRTDGTLANALANNSFSGLTVNLPGHEYKLLYRIIFSASNSNDKCQLRDVNDQRTVQGGGSATATPTSVATIIRETSGPTDLPIGDIADGYLLKRSGASVIGTPETSYLLVDGTRAMTGQLWGPTPTVLTPSGTTQTVDWNNGNIQTLDLNNASGDVTVSFSNVKAGASYILKTIQDASTPRNLVLSGVKLPGGSSGAVTLSTGSNAIDAIAFFTDENAALYAQVTTPAFT